MPGFCLSANPGCAVLFNQETLYCLNAKALPDAGPDMKQWLVICFYAGSAAMYVSGEKSLQKRSLFFPNCWLAVNSAFSSFHDRFEFL